MTFSGSGFGLDYDDVNKSCAPLSADTKLVVFEVCGWTYLLDVTHLTCVYISCECFDWLFSSFMASCGFPAASSSVAFCGITLRATTFFLYMQVLPAILENWLVLMLTAQPVSVLGSVVALCSSSLPWDIVFSHLLKVVT